MAQLVRFLRRSIVIPGLPGALQLPIHSRAPTGELLEEEPKSGTPSHSFQLRRHQMTEARALLTDLHNDPREPFMHHLKAGVRETHQYCRYVPLSAMFPSSRTMMRSTRAMVDSRCATTSTSSAANEGSRESRLSRGVLTPRPVSSSPHPVRGSLASSGAISRGAGIARR